VPSLPVLISNVLPMLRTRVRTIASPTRRWRNGASLLWRKSSKSLEYFLRESQAGSSTQNSHLS